MIWTPGIIDASHHQETFPWDAVENGRVPAAIHKATEGTVFADKRYTPRANAAAVHKLPWAAYHMVTRDDPADQAKAILGVIGTLSFIRIALDVERNEGDPTRSPDASHVAGVLRALNGKVRVDAVGIYGGSYLDGIMAGASPNDFDLIAACWLWVADWPKDWTADDVPEIADTPTMPRGWDWCELWQYREGKAGAPGLAAYDTSAYHGTLDQMRAWFRGVPIGSVPTSGSAPPA